MQLPERYHQKYEKTENGCWQWTDACHPRDGYGFFKLDGRSQYAHRLAVGLEKGQPGVVMHTCDNPGCVNPDHLRVGTQQDNLADMHAKKRGANAHRRGF